MLLVLHCGSPDRVLEIPIAASDVLLSIEDIHDYHDALIAIVTVMVHTLNLPRPHAQGFLQ